MSNNYETLCIVKPDVGEEAVKGIVTKLTSAVEGRKGTVVKVDEWGRRRLAYPIQKNKEGIYFLLTYSSAPDAKNEIDRILKFNEDVMRSQTIRLGELPAEPEVPEVAEASAAPAAVPTPEAEAKPEADAKPADAAKSESNEAETVASAEADDKGGTDE